MKKTISKVCFLIFILAIIMIPIKVNAATFDGVTERKEATYIVPFGREIGINYESNETITSNNTDICIVDSSGKLKIVGSGGFSVTSQIGDTQKQINFFAWNVHLREGGYAVYTDVSRKNSAGNMTASIYFAVSETSDSDTFKIEEHLFIDGKYEGDLNGKYITNYYDKENDISLSRFYEYALDKKFDGDDEVGGGDPTSPEDDDPDVIKVKLGKTYTPTSNESLTWSVSNEDILNIEDKTTGKVRAIRVGKTELVGRTSDGTIKATLKISVYRDQGQIINVEKIVLDKTKIELDKGKTDLITATVEPSYADNRKVSWVTSNNAVAGVSIRGRVIARTAGTAIITASTVNGTKATCKVTVKDGSGGGGGSDPGTSSGTSNSMEILFISPSTTVDAIYIKVGDKSAFIDGGHYSDAANEISYLKKLGVTHIDYYICSHSHNNHVGAGGPIIYTFGIKKIYLGREQQSGTYASYKTIISAINSKCPKATKESMLNAVKSCEIVVVKPEDTFSINDLNIKCLGPVKTYSVSNDENENSIILRLQYKNTSFLFGGDTEKKSWSETIKKYGSQLDVDLMKHTHHGHTSSTKAEWYRDYFKPKYVIFTTSKSCIPKSSYTSKLSSYGCKCYVTTPNRDGNIFVKSDGTNITIKTKYNP